MYNHSNLIRHHPTILLPNELRGRWNVSYEAPDTGSYVRFSDDFLLALRQAYNHYTSLRLFTRGT